MNNHIIYNVDKVITEIKEKIKYIRNVETNKITRSDWQAKLIRILNSTVKKAQYINQ